MPENPPEIPIPDWSTWAPDIEATLMFVHQGSRVLLIEKLRGIGEGKINGPGGKIDPGETPEECVIRECQEELHITCLDPVKRGELWFAMTDLPDIHCHVALEGQIFDGKFLFDKETIVAHDLVFGEESSKRWRPRD